MILRSGIAEALGTSIVNNTSKTAEWHPMEPKSHTTSAKPFLPWHFNLRYAFPANQVNGPHQSACTEMWGLRKVGSASVKHAVVEVFSRRNESYGKFCRIHGNQRLKLLEAEERPVAPPKDVVASKINERKNK